MNKKVQRILLILLLASNIVFGFYNYSNGKTSQSALIIMVAFMGFLIIGQTAALIREWKEE